MSVCFYEDDRKIQVESSNVSSSAFNQKYNYILEEYLTLLNYSAIHCYIYFFHREYFYFQKDFKLPQVNM